MVNQNTISILSGLGAIDALTNNFWKPLGLPHLVDSVLLVGSLYSIAKYL